MRPDPAPEADRLVELVEIDPVSASTAATGMLRSQDLDRAAQAKLLWVRGRAQSKGGQLSEARDTLVEAVAKAEDPVLTARIRSSLAFVLGHLGELQSAAEILLDVQEDLAGAERARVVGQLGTIRLWQGRLDEAIAAYRAACVGLSEPQHRVAAGRFRGNLGAALALHGEFAAAADSLEIAVDIARSEGNMFELGSGLANLGYVATMQGDLPAAIEWFVEAEASYVAVDARQTLPRLHADHAQALANAGLFADADGLVDRAIEAYREQEQETELASALLTAAEIRLARGDTKGAHAAAAEAREKFDDQDRASWAAVADALALQIETRSGTSGALAGQLDDAARTLDRFGWPREAVRCRLEAARLLAGGRGAPAISPEDRRTVARGSATDRVLLAQIDARVAVGNGDRTAARSAINRGLRIATAAQAGLGSIETRAHAAAHGHELVELGARLAVADRRPRELLARIEATRVIASRMPSVRPPADAEMAGLLAELRSLDLKVADPGTDPGERQLAESRRLNVERQVRRHSRTQRGDGATVNLNKEITEAIRLLGDRQLVAHAALDGHLYAVAVVAGRSTLHDLGPLGGVRDKVEGVAFALNRLNRGQGSDASRLAAAEMLFGLSDELAEFLLPPPVAESFDPVVVVPTAVLHDVPWGLLPPLAGRAVAVNASFTGWARAERARRDRARRPGAGFVAGPGLEFADIETHELASYYADAVALSGDEATGERCLELFGEAGLVHVACHGTFRTDNPLFSSIHVTDGPLNVYDFERVEQLPDTVILSACSVAGSKVLQGGSLLGLATALTTLGACTVIAPLTPVSDAASVTVMQRLHQAIVAGDAPAAALASAIMSHDIADPTAAAFIALGA